MLCLAHVASVLQTANFRPAHLARWCFLFHLRRLHECWAVRALQLGVFLQSEDSSAESEVFPSANRPDPPILLEMRLFTDGQLRGASGRVLGQATQPLALWPQVARLPGLGGGLSH